MLGYEKKPFESAAVMDFGMKNVVIYSEVEIDENEYGGLRINLFSTLTGVYQI